MHYHYFEYYLIMSIEKRKEEQVYLSDVLQIIQLERV